MKMLAILVVIGIASFTHAALIPVDTVKDQCKHGDKIYKVGDKITKSPCQPCFCGNGGRMTCMIIDCMAPMCVDAFRKPGGCCSTCPNGSNCYLPDGTIMSANKPYAMTDGSICKCTTGIGMGWSPRHPNATCLLPVVKLPDNSV